MKTTKLILGGLLLVVGAAFLYFFWWAIVGIVAGAFLFGAALLGVFIVVAFVVWITELWAGACLYVLGKLWEAVKTCSRWFINLVQHG